MKSTEFQPLDLFRFWNKPEHSPETVFRVSSITEGWIHCRVPMPNKDGEYRFSFSDQYLEDAVAEKCGKGVEPEKPKVYTKKNQKRSIMNSKGTWSPPVKRRGRKPKPPTEQA